jgi:hypothetical protein
MFANKAMKNAIIVIFFIVIFLYVNLINLEWLLLTLRMIINRKTVAVYSKLYCKISISKSLTKDINTTNPIKKLQYMYVTVRFLILLFLTKGLSSRSETSLIPTTL